MLHVVIIGGGLMGVTSAHYLLAAGHSVTLLDRREELAAEGSHANGGIFHAGHADPWNSPAALAQLVRSLGGGDRALRLRAARLPALAGWGLRFLWHCRRARREAVTRTNTELAVWSRGLLRELIEATGIDFDYAATGSLKIFRSADRLEQARAAAARAEPLGVAARVLDADGAVAREPTLAAIRDELAGGIYFAGDAVGDAARFTRALGETIRGAGARLCLGETVQRLEGSRDGVTGVVTDLGVHRGDAYLLANGVDAPALARPLGVGLPIEPVKGYSATLALPHAIAAPTVPLIDEARQVVMARLGDRLRIAGVAELAGIDRRIRPAAVERVMAAGLANVPDLADRLDRDTARYWACLRPVSADGAPLLGATRVPNLFVNTGAGHLGWTLATGASRLAADAVMARADTTDGSVSPRRFRG